MGSDLENEATHPGIPLVLDVELKRKLLRTPCSYERLLATFGRLQHWILILASGTVRAPSLKFFMLNELVFRDRKMSTVNLISAANNLLIQSQATMVNPCPSTRPPPPSAGEGWYTITVDAAWANPDSLGGFDSSRAADPEEVEAISVIRGMQATLRLGLPESELRNPSISTSYRDSKIPKPNQIVLDAQARVCTGPTQTKPLNEEQAYKVFDTILKSGEVFILLLFLTWVLCQMLDY
ncbi:hypothetical protein GIB67_004389 [Kingdonia uniflora]|uniref:Uncharacterized protein n=1 Tax=Kingdonia uniflora TaxID=39325 RepID=A0A7J7MRC0_9MAGN|nr:hypothetical protein GIB67_004389 [Kingdonia uniflora]